MKRDMELVRKLLFFFEEKPSPEHVKVPPIEGYTAVAGAECNTVIELTLEHHAA